MTGIREYFAELSGDDVDWFQLAFWFEQQVEQRNERQRERYAPKTVNAYHCSGCGSREHNLARCDDPNRHGTRSRYVYQKCRCDQCRAANTNYWRGYYAQRKAA